MLYLNLNSASNPSARSLTIPSAKVETYDTEKNKETSRPRFKAILTSEQYIFRKATIGEGGFGKVYVALEPQENRFYAIKEFVLKPHKAAGKNEILRHKLRLRTKEDLSKRLRDNATSLCAEVALSEACNRIHGPLNFAVNKQQSRVYVVQNLLSGTASSAIEFLAPRYCQRQAITFYVAWSALDDLAFLASKDIKHFDISPDNLLYDKNQKVVQLIDFGSADRGTDMMVPRTSKQEYSPDSQRYQEEGDETNDVFSMGLTLADLAIKRPFLGQHTIVGHSEEPVTASFTLTSGHVMGTRAMSAAQRNYHDDYLRELRLFSVPFAELCMQMVNGQVNAQQAANQMADLFRELPQLEQNNVLQSWEHLPDYSRKIVEHMNILRGVVPRIRSGALLKVK